MAASPRVAWLGLGNMGRGMVRNVAEKGAQQGPITIWNRTTARAEKLSQDGPEGKFKVASSVLDAVEAADIVFISVGDDKAVTSTVDEILKAPSIKGKLIVDTSTILPETTNKISELVTNAGAEFVACPVFGAPAMADNGQLICVLAGPKELVDKVKPFCKGVMARAEIDLSGQKPGTATHLKVIGNTFIVAMVETLAEGHTLAEGSGLGTDVLHKYIEVMFPGPYTAYSTRMMSGDYWKREEPLFAVDLARKDVGHALSIAKSAGVEMNSLKVADEHLKMLKEHAGPSGDIAGIYGAVRKESGMKFEN